MNMKHETLRYDESFAKLSKQTIGNVKQGETVTGKKKIATENGTGENDTRKIESEKWN